MKRVGRQEIVNSSLWKITETLCTKGASFVISVILARLLLPSDYGIVAIADVFINFSTLLVQSGLNTALIRKESVDDEDYSNAFIMCMGIAAACYLAFFISAPAIAAYYQEDLVVSVLRVQMLSLFLCALGTVRNAIIVREFKFKQLAIINFIAVVIGGVCGILIALNGGGVWALVFYTLIRDGAATALLFLVVRWKMTFKISKVRMMSLLGFSVWVLVASLLDFFGNNAYSLVIGKSFSLTDLGYYNRGAQLPQIVCLYTFGAISSVLLPALAQVQTSINDLKRRVRKMVKFSSYIIFPMITGLAVIGNPLVELLFTEKWLPCVPILWASCISFGVNPLRTISVQTIYAVGKSNEALIIEVIRFILLMAGLFAGVKMLHVNVYQLTFIMAGIAVVNIVVCQLFAGKHCDYSMFEWLGDLKEPIILSAVMGALVYGTGTVLSPFKFGIIIEVMVGAAAYVALSILFKSESYYEIVDIIRKRRNRE